MNYFIPLALASAEPAEAEANTEVPSGKEAEAHEGGGLSLDPAVVGFQALNFIVLLAVLNLILYKPLAKLLSEREKKIKDGVENAEKAEASLKEATSIREDMMKTAKVESQTMMDRARKDGEGLKNTIVADAQDQAKKIIDNGHQVIALEKAKTMEDLKAQAVGLIVKTAEKVIREKMDSGKDAKMIEESLNSFAA